MAIISQIGRKSLKVRLLIGSMYAMLLIGAVTMVYPFMLMIAGTTKSGVDTPESRMIPAFYLDDEALYRKDAEGFFNEYLDVMRSSYDSEAPSFRKMEMPKEVNKKYVDEWGLFLQEKTKEGKLPFYTYGLSYIETVISKNTLPLRLRQFKAELVKEFGTIETMNLKFNTDFPSWNLFRMRAQSYLFRRYAIDDSPLGMKYLEFKEKQPIADKYYFCPAGYFETGYLKNQYTKHIEKYNETHGTNYGSWEDVVFTRRVPTNSKEKTDWVWFVRNALNLIWIKADAQAKAPYQSFLEAKYSKISNLNKNYGTKYSSFKDIPLYDKPLGKGMAQSDWNAFVQGWKDPDTGKLYILPENMIYISSIEFWFQDYLKDKYGDIQKMNKALGTNYKDFAYIFPPQEDFHYEYFKKHTDELRWEFTRRNFISVWDYIVLHGRGILNTVIYCLLAIAAALIVNPLAAYALSRYRPPSAYKVLLFLMLTMAFPPMVTQIPMFLMLREFNLLNSFWALILPILANGYSIFLLKGFFDSLPQELYESAEIDGAGEFRIFWQITMSLSTPILAVIALQAFTGAYANFMMALLICQDENMWTLMPWLYKLQTDSCQGIVFASLIIAAVPTFLVFAFCQNIIMRGIVVPVEK